MQLKLLLFLLQLVILLRQSLQRCVLLTGLLLKGGHLSCGSHKLCLQVDGFVSLLNLLFLNGLHLSLFTQVLLLQIFVVAHLQGQILRVKRHLTDVLLVAAHLGTGTSSSLIFKLLNLLLSDEELVLEFGDGAGLFFKAVEQLIEIQLALLSLLLCWLVLKLERWLRVSGVRGSLFFL